MTPIKKACEGRLCSYSEYHLWYRIMVSNYGIELWYRIMVSNYGIESWYRIMVSNYGIELWYQSIILVRWAMPTIRNT
ncbi:hypothetical protein NIES4071_70370 [Calothrix sp. NIES-4071]|nr:hypothetical protein NIES4071_70370 [Calothrix sp. NIES-4071]BAZ61312.1 hypothetical protein NIES4105_70320 [Calothrix sp. NIES-4105]